MLDLWTAVDHYIDDLVVQSDSALEETLQAIASAGLPAISVSPSQGKLLWLFARLVGARSILEIGTLGGYSTIWLARALRTDGRLITLEIDPKHADVARGNFARAGVSNLIELRQGPAIDSLAQLDAEGLHRFDLVFVDADKPSNSDYFAWALRLTRPGSLIVIDNVVRAGTVLNSDASDINVEGARRVLEMMGAESSVSATVIQTVGSKGYDGFAIARVTDSV